MHIVAVSGSLRTASSNTKLLKAARLLAPIDMRVSLYDALDLLPHFSPDRDAELPLPAVAELRRHIGSADGLLLCVPEYAHGIPGSFKNLLDWLVSSGETDGLPVVLLNTAPRAVHAQDQLREVLQTMNAVFIFDAPVTVFLAHPADEPEMLAADPAVRDALSRVYSAFRAIADAQRR